MEKIVPEEHKFLQKYSTTMSRIIGSIFPDVDIGDIRTGVNYSIQKRFKNFDLKVKNNYTNTLTEMTALKMMDYIDKREPIITSYGTMFKRYETVPNPMGMVIQSFLDLRKKHKKEMFKYPKGSEMFEKFNLLQALDKIDVNG